MHMMVRKRKEGVRVSGTQLNAGSIQGGVPLSRVNTNPDDDDDDDEFAHVG